MSNLEDLVRAKQNPHHDNKVLFSVVVVVVFLSLLHLSESNYINIPISIKNKYVGNGKVDLSEENTTFNDSIQLNPVSINEKNFNLTSSKPSLFDREKIALIAEQIKIRNSEQVISNLAKFHEVKETTTVLLIQVHSRLENLKILISSLSYVYEIENSLLIFSHDVFSPEMNHVIEQIDFARVLQIFYPHSVQLNPNRFPGDGFNDCPKRISPQMAKKIQCENWKYPDRYGNYREAKYTQPKHHWWWKANFVFNHVTVLENHTGLVAFLEEDHYASPDLLWTLNFLGSSMRENHCEGCGLLALGQRQPKLPYINTTKLKDPALTSKVTVTNKYITNAVVFNRTFWEFVEKCTLKFCTYDDCNWDFSLKSVFRSCFPQPVRTLYVNFPRIFHNGRCNGLHKHASLEGCDIFKTAKKIRETLERLMELKLLFPETIELKTDFKAMRTNRPYGGWGDIRDRHLCISFSKLFSNSSLL